MIEHDLDVMLQHVEGQHSKLMQVCARHPSKTKDLMAVAVNGVRMCQAMRALLSGQTQTQAVDILRGVGSFIAAPWTPKQFGGKR